MQKQIKKNINQRLVFKQNEKKRLIIKSVTQNLIFKKNLRWKIQRKFFKFSLTSTLSRIKNICIITGRSRSVYRFFKLSRIQLKKFISKKELPGISKYSW